MQIPGDEGPILRVDELLQLFARDRDAAWEALQAALISSSLHACRVAGVGASEAENLAHDGLERAARCDFAALRNAEGTIPLGAWTNGIARNLVWELLRARRSSGLDETTATIQADDHTEGWEAIDMSSLTHKEAIAVREVLEGRSERAAARTLGISRSTLRDRVTRAVRRLQRIAGTLPPLPRMSRHWAENLLDTRPRWLKARERICLLLYAKGGTRRDIARRLGLSTNGVKCLLHALKHRPQTGSTPERAPSGRARTRGPSRGRAGRSST